MKILIATGLYPPEIGGPATHTVMMEKYLPNYGFKVKVLPFSSVRKYPKIIRHIVYFLKCWFLSFGHDVVFAQDTVSVGFPSALATLFSITPFIVRVPGDYVWEQARQRFGVKDDIDDFQHKNYGLKVWFLRKIQNFTVNQANRVVTPSDYFNNLVSKWINNPKKIETIYNGVNLNYGKYIRWKPQPKTKRIISAGRLVMWKGFDKLIEFMVDLPDWKLVIFGDGPERESLKAKAEKLGLGKRVVFKGSVPRDELLEYLKSIDASIFTLNTSFESFSFQIVEVMDAGVPIITTNIGSIPELIKNNREGVLIEPNNREEFLSAVNRIVSSESLREDFVIKAQLKAKEFSVENTITGFVNLFNRITR